MKPPARFARLMSRIRGMFVILGRYCPRIKPMLLKQQRGLRKNAGVVGLWAISVFGASTGTEFKGETARTG